MSKTIMTFLLFISVARTQASLDEINSSMTVFINAHHLKRSVNNNGLDRYIMVVFSLETYILIKC